MCDIASTATEFAMAPLSQAGGVSLREHLATLQAFFPSPGFAALGKFISCMCRRCVEQTKVFYSVIYSLAIDVMNCLVASKVSAQMFFHNKPVFQYAFSGTGERVVRAKNLNVPESRNMPTTFPLAAFLTSVFGTLGNSQARIRAESAFSPSFSGHTFGVFGPANCTNLSFHSIGIRHIHPGFK